jgi:hypothetical protein
MIDSTDLYEEWIGFPDAHAYVPLKDHDKQSCLRGWWVSGWRVTKTQVDQLPQPKLLVIPEDE